VTHVLAQLASGEQDSSKFCSHAKDFILGEPKIAALGLEEYMLQQCNTRREEAVAAIEGEFRAHGTKEDLEWFEYITQHAASQHTFKQGVRDEGRDAVKLADFMETEEARIARLHPAHVLALRLCAPPPPPPAPSSLSPCKDVSWACDAHVVGV